MVKLLNKNQIRQFYEKDYLELYNRIDLLDLEVKYSTIKPFLDKISLKNKRVLDVGCGMGGMLHKISNQHHFTPIGSDISFKTLLSEPINRHARVQADAERLPFRKANIGLIYFIDLLEHLSSPQKFLENLKGLSEKVLMFVPMESAILNDIIYFLRKIRGKRTNLEQYGHIHRFNFKKLKKLLVVSGFSTYDFDIVLYDDFAKYSSFRGKMLNFISKFIFKISSPLHRKLFGGYTFIALCDGDSKNV